MNPSASLENFLIEMFDQDVAFFDCIIEESSNPF